jgi:hypothetical protein
MRRSRPSPVSQQIVLRLHLLQHQLFTNVCPVPSAHSGGLHGHLVLAMLLTDTDYLTRAGVAHIVPVHAGPPPLLVGTGVIIAVAFWAYTDALSNVTLYNNLSSAALTPQLLNAVKTSFLSVLEDPNFGFRGVTPCAMLTHLHNNCGTPTPEEMEKNRAALPDPRNLDDRIVDFWAKIASNIQRVATFGKRPHCRYHIITHTLAMFEKTGLLLIAAEKFCLRPSDDKWTVARSSPSFNSATRNASLPPHSQQSWISPRPQRLAYSHPASAAAIITRHVTVKGGKMFYCWTHCLSTHPSHACIKQEEVTMTTPPQFHDRREQHNLSRPSSPACFDHQLTARGAYCSNSRQYTSSVACFYQCGFYFIYRSRRSPNCHSI